jgi:large subunit ribosomal protein L24
MKQEFSKSWKSSTQPRKQRKYTYNAPLHIKTKFLAAHLSDALAEKHKRTSAGIRKGDEVLVMRGEFKKRTAKVVRVDAKTTKIYLEGLNVTKRDGTKVEVAIHPSNVRLTTLVDDKFRFKVGERSNTNQAQPAEKKEAPVKQAPAAKTEKKTPAPVKKEAKK